MSCGLSNLTIYGSCVVNVEVLLVMVFVLLCIHAMHVKLRNRTYYMM